MTTAAVVIPKAMAYASIAGLPLETGLYTSLIPLVVYALVGTSRRLSVTTTSTVAILVAGAVAEHRRGVAGEPADGQVDARGAGGGGPRDEEREEGGEQ